MSKELRALERMEYILKVNCHHYKQDVGYIREALLKAQEQEKVLEIIFEKPLNAIIFSEMKKGLDIDDYNELSYEEFSREMKDYYEEEGIEQFPTEKEFELLKRWLNEKDN